MGGNIDPGDHHSVGGTDFVVLREASVDVLAGSTEDIGAGVVAEENLPHPVARVQVALQSANHAEIWGHFAKIVGLVRGLCYGDKTVGVDLKFKAQVGRGGRKMRLELISLMILSCKGLQS